METQKGGTTSHCLWLRCLTPGLPISPQPPSPQVPDAAQHPGPQRVVKGRGGPATGEVVARQGVLYSNSEAREYEGKQMNVTSGANTKQ